MPTFAIPIAEIAQLVEHDLAKVGVASSSLVFRSRFSLASVGLFSYIMTAHVLGTGFAVSSGNVSKEMNNIGKFIMRLMLSVLLSAAQVAGSVVGAQDSGLQPYRDWFGSYGYVDSLGNIVVDCQFDDAKNFSEGLAAVLSRGGSVSEDGVFGQLSLTLKWGYVDTSGLTVIPCRFDFADQFAGGYAAVMSGNRWGFIDHDGDTLVTYRYDEVRRFVNGYAAVCRNGLWGYVDTDGNELVPCRYDMAEDFGSDGFAAVRRADSTGFVFRDGLWYATKDRALNWIRGIPFSVYAKDKVMNRVNEWQLPEPGETVPDWEARVNDETFAARLEGLEMRYEAEYTGANRLEDPELVPGPYDAASGTFPVEIIDRGDHGDGRHFHIDLPVPADEAREIADTWKRADAQFRYFVSDDHTALAQVTLDFPGRRTFTWTSPDYNPKRTLLLDYDLEDLDFTLPGKIYRRMMQDEADSAAADIDTAVPERGRRSSDMYAVVIANENYTTGMTVPYALNDGAVFREYCRSRLHIPEDQTYFLTNAGAGDISSLMQWLDKTSRVFDADTRILLYFSGQCLLDKGVGETYLLPVDYATAGVQSGLGLSSLYSRISQWGVDDALILVDASYGKISRNGMRVNVFRDRDTPQEWLRPKDRIVTFYAAGENEAALPYPKMRHGLFTYFLLKALQQHPEEISFGALFDFISENVRTVAEQLYGVVQRPQVWSSEWDGEAWREFSL